MQSKPRVGAKLNRSVWKRDLRSYATGKVNPTVSARMAKVPLKNSRPELALRSALWNAGFRYRLHPVDLPGRPDIANKARKVAIFVDGCFWHGCPKHFRSPKTRTEFWREKIRRNRANRARHLGAYPPEWFTMSIYECELAENTAALTAHVVGAARLTWAPNRRT